MTVEAIAPLSDSPRVSPPQSHPDRAANRAQKIRSHIATRDTIPIRS